MQDAQGTAAISYASLHKKSLLQSSSGRGCEGCRCEITTKQFPTPDRDHVTTHVSKLGPATTNRCDKHLRPVRRSRRPTVIACEKKTLLQDKNEAPACRRPTTRRRQQMCVCHGSMQRNLKTMEIGWLEQIWEVTDRPARCAKKAHVCAVPSKDAIVAAEQVTLCDRRIRGKTTSHLIGRS